MQGDAHPSRGAALRLTSDTIVRLTPSFSQDDMARRIFISYQHDDRMKAKGFNLLRWNKNVDVEFVGRHLLDPVDSTNRDYIRAKIKEELAGTSVTVILIGKKCADSDWVANEIQWSQEKGNGLRLDDDCEVPDALVDAGAEVIGWDPHSFGGAIERAATAAGRVESIASSVGGSGGTCAR